MDKQQPIDQIWNAIGKVDFTKGFKHFFFRWPLSRGECSVQIPHDSKYPITCGLHKIDKSAKGRYQLRIRGGKYGMAIVGGALVGKDGNVIQNEAVVLDWDPMGSVFSSWDLPEEYCKPEHKTATVHFWVDIPISCSHDPTKSPVSDKGLEALSSTTAKLFNHVVCKNGASSFHDVVLAVVREKGESPLRQFYCHRDYLACASDVFTRIFSDPSWRENEKGLIEITDISPEAMEYVLRFIYTGRPVGAKKDEGKMEKETYHSIILEVVFAADKYGLPSLKEWCEMKLILSFNGNKYRIKQLEIAQTHRLHQLKAVCIALLSGTCWSWIGVTETQGRFQPALLSEMIKAAAKRQFGTNPISV